MGTKKKSNPGRRFDEEFKREAARLAAQHGVIPSMSRAGNCYDNAHMESFWATLKTELLQGRVFATHAEARRAIFLYIETFYNRARLHGALGYTSPVEYESNPG